MAFKSLELRIEWNKKYVLDIESKKEIDHKIPELSYKKYEVPEVRIS